ncbi:fibronectin type III domain-containing protein [Kandleria vitulina]|uniref:fibronectin type III domain-containing protein n=1 Tax=Kandleria vitulina TaxID=1630 RepID=UPI0004906E92|nr:fibronectin type III domain-containing protein [Kandleria vitulina]
MKMNKKLGAALALSMVVGATTTVPVMAETTNNPEKTTKDTTKSATDLRKEANTAKAEYDKAAAASKKADQELANAQNDVTYVTEKVSQAKAAKKAFVDWQITVGPAEDAIIARSKAAEKLANQGLTIDKYETAKKNLDEITKQYNEVKAKYDIVAPSYANYNSTKNDHDTKKTAYETFCTNNNISSEEDAKSLDIFKRAEYNQLLNEYNEAKNEYQQAEKDYNEKKAQYGSWEELDALLYNSQNALAQRKYNAENDFAPFEEYDSAVKTRNEAVANEGTARDVYKDATKAYGKSFNSEDEWNNEVTTLETAKNTANDVLTKKKNAANEAKNAAAALKTAYDKAEQKAVAAEKAEEALRLAEEARKAAEAKPDKVTLKKATSKKKKTVKVTWNKAKNAKTYQVAYRRKKSAKKWTKWVYKVVKGKSYTNKKLKSKKTYQFKVRGLNGKIKGAFSSKKKVTVK